MSEFYEIIFVK